MFVGFGFVSGVYSVFVSTFLFKSRLSHFDSLGKSVGRIGGMHYPLCKARSMLGVLFSFFVVTASFDPAVAGVHWCLFQAEVFLSTTFSCRTNLPSLLVCEPGGAIGF